MEFHYLPLLFSLTVILMAAQAALPPEIYWERMLPNTPIPKTIRDLPKLGYKEIQEQDEMLSSQDPNLFFYNTYGVKKNQLQDGVKETLSSQEPNLLFYKYGVKKNQLQDGVEETLSSQDPNLFFYDTYGVKKNQLQDGVKETLSSQEPNLLFYKYGVKKNQLQDGVKETLSSQDPNLLFYKYGVKKNQLQDGVKEMSSSQDETPFDHQSKENLVIREVVPVASHHHHHDHSKSSIFLSEQELRSGAKLETYFPKTKYLTPLLPRQIAEHLPFSSGKINEIIEILGVKPKSKNAENVEEALKDCEAPAINGEEKYCATSVESMIDFVTSKLGKNVHVTSTELENESKSQMFLVKDGVKILAEEEIISCHPMNYPYVVFYCHKLSNGSAYFMPLEGEDGSRVKAVAVCHKDTSEWDPNHIAFQVLKGKPGTIPVCHFFPDGHLLWYAK